MKEKDIPGQSQLMYKTKKESTSRTGSPSKKKAQNAVLDVPVQQQKLKQQKDKVQKEQGVAPI